MAISTSGYTIPVDRSLTLVTSRIRMFFMTTTNKTMSNDEAAKAIAKVTAKLNREGHSELSMEIIKLAAKYLAK